ncbi:MAG: hypothetical protein AAFX06_17605 [Planctomycetota bacterium]
MSVSLRMFVLLCLLLGSVACTRGQRLLKYEIEVDGQVRYIGMRGVVDSTPVEEMWNELGQVVFEPVQSATTPAVNPAGDEEVSGARLLEGKIVVRIRHVDRELATASLPKLTIPADQAASWNLEDLDVQRIRSAAGH